MIPSRHTIWILSTVLLWAVACTSPAGDAAAKAPFVVMGDAVVRDARTGLEWTRHDDGVGLGWYEADAYCQGLAIDDAGRWRLPGIEELRSLYGVATRVPCGDAMCAIDPAFSLTGPFVWSATADGTARTYLDFRYGTELSPSLTPRLVRRVLCVRTSAVPGPGTARGRGYRVLIASCRSA